MIQTFNYTHPLFDAAALEAQDQLWRLQGEHNTWFCGSYFGYGFHEDALQSGLAVADALGESAALGREPHPHRRCAAASGRRMSSAIYVGTVQHERLRPRRHKLTYRVFSLLIDLDEVADAARCRSS